MSYADKGGMSIAIFCSGTFYLKNHLICLY